MSNADRQVAPWGPVEVSPGTVLGARVGRLVGRGWAVCGRGATVLALLLAGVLGLPGGLAEGASAARGGRAQAVEAELPWPEPEAKTVEAMKAELREALPAEGFLVLSLGPWVVATNLDGAEARSFVDSTIRRYGSAIQRQLFSHQPRSKAVKVYLFKDHESYTVQNLKLFGERPSTPYGYFSRQKNALVMNIGTGGGTLLHEMVHAMAEEDYPEIPAWLNEGLGSLFEASNMTAEGKVVGVVNWRLSGLQRDLAGKQAPAFEELVGMSDRDFYARERSGSNYAAARYLMQWLQEQGKLEAYYRRMRERKDADAKAALRAVFEDKFTLSELQTRCYDWVKTLKRQ